MELHKIKPPEKQCWCEVPARWRTQSCAALKIHGTNSEKLRSCPQRTAYWRVQTKFPLNTANSRGKKTSALRGNWFYLSLRQCLIVTTISPRAPFGRRRAHRCHNKTPSQAYINPVASQGQEYFPQADCIPGKFLIVQQCTIRNIPSEKITEQRTKYRYSLNDE